MPLLEAVELFVPQGPILEFSIVMLVEFIMSTQSPLVVLIVKPE